MCVGQTVSKPSLFYKIASAQPTTRLH